MIFAFDEFELDAERLSLRRAGKLIKVESSAVRLLLALLRRAGELVSKDELVEEVWEGRAVADNVITVAMARLRKALLSGRAGKPLVGTVYGRGYRFERPVIARHDSVLTPSSQPAARNELPYVGRDHVLARLRAALADARAGHGRLCVLTGEPGIGKTRAVEMLERELAAGSVRVAWGYCREAGETPPLWPWQELLNEITGSAKGPRLGEDSGASSDKTAQFHFSDAPLAARGPALLAPSDTARQRAFESFLSSLTLATEQLPWLLVLDDLHRADAASLELLSHLVDRIARTPILLVATLRPLGLGGEARHDTQLPRILGHRNCESIALERLQTLDVEGYVATFIDDPQSRLGRAIYRKSEGNPFFMAELVRQLRDSGGAEPEALTVPDAALELVRQRVAQVDAAARGLLSTCAVIGRSFELSLLSEVTEQSPSALMLALDAARRENVVVSAPHAKTAFAFSHELMRAVLYDGLSLAEKRQLHLRVGEGLERRLLAGDLIAASEIAYHFHAALPSGDLRRTVHYCRKAAEAAVPVFAYSDVARFTQQALEALLLIERPSIKLRMSLLYLAAIYLRPHDSPSYARAVAELTRLGREHRDAEMLVRAGALLNAHPGLLPLPGRSTIIEPARRMLPETSLGLRALATAGLSSTIPHCYSADASEALASEAVALARAANSRGATYVALINQLYLLGGPAHESHAQEIAAQLEHLALNNPVELAALPIDVAFYRANHALCAGLLASARAAIERALARSRALHHAELSWHSERVLALLQAEHGEGREARVALTSLHERATRLGLFGTAVFCAYDRALLLADGEPGSLLDGDLRAALQYDAEDAPAFWALKLRALAALGQHDEARAALRNLSPAALTQLPCDIAYLGTLGHLTHAALLLGEASYYAALEAALARYPDHFACQLFCASDGSVAQLLGLLAEATNRPREAVSQLERAVARNEQAGLSARAAEANLRLARCLLSLGEGRAQERALTLARSARASSGRLGLTQLGREASALLQRAEGS